MTKKPKGRLASLQPCNQEANPTTDFEDKGRKVVIPTLTRVVKGDRPAEKTGYYRAPLDPTTPENFKPRRR